MAVSFFRSFLFVALVMVGYAVVAQDTTQYIVEGRHNSLTQEKKPYVIMISIDGFRWDYADKFNAKNIIALRNGGVQADYMKPSFPSLTFPNHYTLVTGMYPSHHGIVDNMFYDKTKDVIYKRSDKKMVVDNYWYKGKPLWVLAEEQNMLSAVFYWPGSEIEIDGLRPTYYYAYNEIIPIERRLNIVKDWLELPTEKRPHFIALYFPQVDKAGHNYSPDAEQTKQAVLMIDSAIGKLNDIAKNTGLAVNFVLLSDHGMTAVDRKNAIPLPEAIDLNHFTVPPGTSILHLYANEKKYIKPTYKALKNGVGFDVYLANKIPKKWNYSKKQDVYGRIGDIVLIPHLPRVFSIHGFKPEIGQHRFDPAIPDMHATFYAWGPQLKNEMHIPAFENVHVYPFIAKMLGLTYPKEIDGEEKVLAPILK